LQVYICGMTITFHLDEIAAAASKFWETTGEKKVIAFHGQMGAGKTTFIHALCDAKHVQGAVSSPTFSIINEYSYAGGIIYHIDLYRLEQEEDAFRAGVEDCLYSGQTCLVEWPERAESLFPADTIHVYIEVTAPEQRRLTIRKT
jgi:tRNA threonylcarbamoyladenosine biosynthesis protein TsaE